VQWVAANGVLFVDSRPGNTRDRSPSSPESAAGAAQRTFSGIRGEENMEERKVERQRHHLNFSVRPFQTRFPGEIFLALCNPVEKRRETII